MAVIAEGDFEGLDSASLRANGSGQDWFESRADDPSLLLHDTTPISGHTSQAKLITSTALGEAYLTQEFSAPLTGISDITWDIYIEDFFDIDGAPDRAGFMLIGDGTDNTTAGPNSDDSERFVCMAFEDAGDSTMQLVAQDSNDGWNNFTTVLPNAGIPSFPALRPGEWHTVKVRSYLENNEYDIFVDNEFIQTFQAHNNKTSLSHISFAQLSNGAGTFYIDNVSQVNLFSVAFSAAADGSITGDTDQLVEDGQDCTEVEAVPDDSYHFINWTGDYEGTDNPLTVTGVSSDMSIDANFGHLVTFSSGANGSITGETRQEVNSGEDCTEVEAVPAEGYYFVNWTGDYEGTDNPLTLTSVTSNMDVTANFGHRVTFSSSGNGSIIGDVTQHVIPGGSCTDVTAEPATGYHFVNWTGDYTSDNPSITVANVTSDMTISANFEIDTFTVDFLATGSGSITGSASQTIEYESSCDVVTAVPGEGYHFVNWTGDFTGDNPSITITNVTADMTITANFEINTYTVTFSAGGNGGLTGNLSQTVEHGGSTSVVTAIPANEYNFLNWSGDYSGNENPLTVTNVTSDMALSANFAINTYSVFFTTPDGGSVSGESNQIVASGESCSSVTAVPGEGYHFLNWSGDVDTDDNPLTISHVTSNMAITANFEINTYTVIFSPGDHGGLNGDISQTVNHGSSCTTITAYPAEGYRFAGWTGDYSGDENPLTLENVTSNMAITAGYVLAFDGNNDGTPDAEQDHIKNLTAENEEIVTVEFSDSSTILECGPVDDPSPDDRPIQYDFDYGLIRFVIDDVETGGATTITIYLPDGASPVTYFKYGRTRRAPTPHWYEFMYDGTTGAEIDGNKITLHFVDGERGDDDLSANGKIEDDGGPGFSDTPPSPDADDSGDSQGASGGCFVSALKAPVIVD